MKNTRRFFKQSFCTILVFALVWVGLPLYVFAASVENLGQILTDTAAELVTDESREPLFLLSDDCRH